MIRVPIVFHPWPRILISQLASFFVARISGVNIIFRPILDLRLIAIGFDLRFFSCRARSWRSRQRSWLLASICAWLAMVRPRRVAMQGRTTKCAINRFPNYQTRWISICRNLELWTNFFSRDE
jgi:hypothetical protein